jgi:hypothetical protein
MMTYVTTRLALWNGANRNELGAKDDLNGTSHCCAVKGLDEKNPSARIA